MFTTKNLLILIIKNAIISIIAIVVSVLFITIINGKITKITDGVVKNHQIENELKKKTELLSVIEKDVALIGENYSLIDQAFIPSDDINNFMSSLDKLGNKDKLIQKYRFDSPVDYQNIDTVYTSTIKYSNNINTNIDKTIKYLREFEVLPYFTKIEGINISSQSKNGWNDDSTNISIRAILLTKSVK